LLAKRIKIANKRQENRKKNGKAYLLNLSKNQPYS